MKILLLEDDHNLHESLKAYLEMEEFIVYSAFTADEAYRLAYENRFDLYIFDVNLGNDENGFEVLKALRNSNDITPTIYASALTDISSITQGFNAGADDYIKKPFDPEELVLRIKSRYMGQENNVLIYKNMSYNVVSRELKQENKVVGLSNILATIFHELITQKNKIVVTNTLLDALISPNSNALRVNISKLKNKLNLDIKNIKGVGYMLEEL